MREYELTLTVRGVKEENAAYNVALLRGLSELFGLDGTDLRVELSVERDHDGLERLYKFLPEASEETS